jgi:hypothetical protein
MDSNENQIAEAAVELKELIAETITTNYPKGVNALVLGYVGIDMVSQSCMSMYAQGEFATIEESQEALFEAIRDSMKQYADNATTYGNDGSVPIM